MFQGAQRRRRRRKGSFPRAFQADGLFQSDARVKKKEKRKIPRALFRMDLFKRMRA